jgi:hypothetical protein
MRYRTWDWVALTLIILGALNWGLIGLFRVDFIAVLFGGMEGVVSRILYTLIALAGLYCLSFIGRTRDIIDTTERTTERRMQHQHQH